MTILPRRIKFERICPRDDCSRTFRRPSLCRSTLVRSVDIACGSFKVKLRGLTTAPAFPVQADLHERAMRDALRISC